MKQRKRFKDQIIIVTGAGSGIGLELVRQLLKSQAFVLAADINTSALVEISHSNLKTVPCDVSEKGYAKRLIESCKIWKGEPNYFFANAGFALYGPQETLSAEAIENMWKVNYHAPIEAVHAMGSTKPASQTVITCSAMAFWGLAGYAQYSATKAALHSFVDVYRQEGGRRIQLIFPVATATQFFSASSKNTPVEWPLQKVRPMVRNTLASVANGSKNIFPYRPFALYLILNRFMGFIKPVARSLSRKRFNYFKKNVN